MRFVIAQNKFMEIFDEFEVEVAYGRPDVQVVIPVLIRKGSTIEQAIRQSGILTSFPEIDLNVNKIGIFGRLSTLHHLLKAGDRIEIYRPLIADAKEIRKQRAAQGKKMKKGSS